MNQIIFQSLFRATYSSKICVFKLKGDLKDACSSHIEGVIFTPLFIIPLPLFEEINSYLFKKRKQLTACYQLLIISERILSVGFLNQDSYFLFQGHPRLRNSSELCPKTSAHVCSLTLQQGFYQVIRQPAPPLCFTRGVSSNYQSRFALKKSWSLLHWHGLKSQDTGDCSIDMLF